MTKEPKLIGARRIVSEWDVLDKRQQIIVDKVLQQQENSSQDGDNLIRQKESSTQTIGDEL